MVGEAHSTSFDAKRRPSKKKYRGKLNLLIDIFGCNPDPNLIQFLNLSEIVHKVKKVLISGVNSDF